MPHRTVVWKTAQTTIVRIVYHASSKGNPHCASLKRLSRNRSCFAEYDIGYFSKIKISTDITLWKHRECIPLNSNQGSRKRCTAFSLG